MAQKTVTSDPIVMKNVRCAFLEKLFVPKPFSTGDDPRHEITFVVDPTSPEGQKTIMFVLRTANDLCKQEFKTSSRAIKELASIFITNAPAFDPKTPADDIVMRFYNGSEKTYAGFAGQFIVPCHNTRKPRVVNRMGLDIGAGDAQAPTRGCIVNGEIVLLVQDNKWGKAINISLRGVQFVSVGPPDELTGEETETNLTALEDGDEGVAGGTNDWD